MKQRQPKHHRVAGRYFKSERTDDGGEHLVHMGTHCQLGRARGAAGVVKRADLMRLDDAAKVELLGVVFVDDFIVAVDALGLL